jgi:hypothetical protein
MGIDQDVFVCAFEPYHEENTFNYAPLSFIVFERKTFKELQTSTIGLANENLLTQERKTPSGRPHLKLFNGFLVFCYHKRLYTHVKTCSSIEIYRKIYKRDTQDVKIMFQHIKSIRKVSLIEANQFDREHLILGTEDSYPIPRETYEYLRLDEQFPRSFNTYEAKDHCQFYKILGPTDFGKLENIRRFAIHHRIKICAMCYPFIVYYFEDIDSIKSEIVDGLMMVIEDTILQVYDIEKKKQIKSFRIQGKNYIKCVKADIYHFVLEVKNSCRDRLESHKYESNIWIWSTKDILNPNIDSQISMENARRVINIQICAHGSDFKMFFSNDIHMVKETKNRIPGKTFHKHKRCVKSFELASITQNYLSAYITGCRVSQKANRSRSKPSQLVFFDFGF